MCVKCLAQGLGWTHTYTIRHFMNICYQQDYIITAGIWPINKILYEVPDSVTFLVPFIFSVCNLQGIFIAILCLLLSREIEDRKKNTGLPISAGCIQQRLGEGEGAVRSCVGCRMVGVGVRGTAQAPFQVVLNSVSYDLFLLRADCMIGTCHVVCIHYLLFSE